MTPEQIAASLTKAQLEAVSRAEWDGKYWLIPWELRERNALEALGITDQDGWQDALTPLGLSVGKLLKERGDANA
jgi:hypothetical protein